MRLKLNMTICRIVPSRSFLLLTLGILLIFFALIVDDSAWEGIFKWMPAHLPEILQLMAGFVIYPLYVFHGFSFMLGTGVIFLCAAKYLSQLEKPVFSSVLLMPLLYDGFIFAQALQFLAVPSGASIRPMGWVFITFLLSCGVTVLGFIYVTDQSRIGRSKLLCAMGYLLSVFPIPISIFSLRLMAAIKGFELAP